MSDKAVCGREVWIHPSKTVVNVPCLECGHGATEHKRLFFSADADPKYQYFIEPGTIRRHEMEMYA